MGKKESQNHAQEQRQWEERQEGRPAAWDTSDGGLVHDGLELLTANSPETLSNRVKGPLGSLGLYQQEAADTG